MQAIIPHLRTLPKLVLLSTARELPAGHRNDCCKKGSVVTASMGYAHWSRQENSTGSASGSFQEAEPNQTQG